MKATKLVLILAAVLVIVLGAVSYLLSSGKLVSRVPYESSLNNIEDQSDSDEADAIEKDLNATNLSGLDSELGDIQKELEAE